MHCSTCRKKHVRNYSATLLADSGTDITCVKRHGGWKSTSVAEGYLENSILSEKPCTPSAEVASASREAADSRDKSFTLAQSSVKVSGQSFSFNNISNCVFYFNK
jgi:hypothetical protein